MKRAITSLILNALLFVLWSFLGIWTVVTEPSWVNLCHGGLMTIYLVTTIDEIRHIRTLVKTTNSPKENQNEKVNV